MTATAGRPSDSKTARRRRSGRARSGDGIIRIVISVEAIARTLPLASVGYEDKTDEEGKRLIVVRVMIGVMVGVGFGYIMTDAI